MSTTVHVRGQAPARLHTIGAVCRRLQNEFPDISISKIRYLEDQGLLSPRRTRGGYRLFGEEDIERLETILRLQRDEFLPLRVIRQELASPSVNERRRRRSGLAAPERELDLGSLCERAGVTPEQARELEEYGLLEPRVESGDRFYTDVEADIASVYARLAKAGFAARNLRKLRNHSEDLAATLYQAMAAELHHRNPEKRGTAVEDLHGLAQLAQDLSQLLFWRALRHRVTG